MYAAAVCMESYSAVHGLSMSQIAKHPKSKSSNKHPRGLTLERFAAAKSSGYNKRDKKEKQFALDAKKVNKYRKLKSKLQQKGMLPRVSQA